MTVLPEQQDARGRGEGPRRAASIGWWVFGILMLLILVEYLVAIWMDRNLPLMVVMNLADAALIMVFFMHVARLWRSREEG